MKKIILLLSLLIVLPIYTMENLCVRSEICLRKEGIFFQQPDDSNLIDVRKKLEKVNILEPENACKIDPTIILYPIVMPERLGVCYDYAMNEILKKYKIKRNFKIIGCEDWQQQLSFFKHVKTCKKDDLIVYFNSTNKNNNINVKVAHFGLIANPQTMRIKGKWGTIKALYEHNVFSLPSRWGEFAIVMRLKKPYRITGEEQNKFINHIKETMESPIETKQLLFNCEQRLLNLVATGKKYDIIQLLEQIPQLSINYRNHLNQTLLMIAVKNNYFDIVKLLLEYGADKTLKDMYGKTALDIAKEKGNVDIINLLG